MQVLIDYSVFVSFLLGQFLTKKKSGFVDVLNKNINFQLKSAWSNLNDIRCITVVNT
jgi:hypothetical protein